MLGSRSTSDSGGLGVAEARLSLLWQASNQLLIIIVAGPFLAVTSDLPCRGGHRVEHSLLTEGLEAGGLDLLLQRLASDA